MLSVPVFSVTSPGQAVAPAEQRWIVGPVFGPISATIVASGACEAPFQTDLPVAAAQVCGRMELHSGAPPFEASAAAGRRSRLRGSRARGAARRAALSSRLSLRP